MKASVIFFTSFLVLVTFIRFVSAQETDQVLQHTLKLLNDLQARVESGQEQKSKNQPSELTSKESRQKEENLNEIARATLRVQQALGGVANMKALYGPDDRKNYDSPRVTSVERQAADATVILVKAQDITASSDGKTVDLPGGNIIDSTTDTGLCNPQQATDNKEPFEPFWDEPNPGFCSGFRISKKRIATAGHCIKTPSDCAKTRFVFGFYAGPGKPHPEKNIPISDVYSCKSIVGGTEVDDGPDWRVVEVDRDIVQGADLTLRTSSMQPPLEPNDSVVVIGYPLGLPVKIADDAIVRSLGKGFFKANCDTYEGNSGSAVFDDAQLQKGHLLVDGILVRGEDDFARTTPCFISKRCPFDGCRGEDITFASEISATNPAPQGNASRAGRQKVAHR